MKNYKIVKLTNITQTTLCGIEPNVTIGIWNNRIFVSAYKWEIKDHIINGDFICHDAEYIEVNIHDALCDIDDMIQDTFRIASDESFNIEVGKVIVNRFKEDAIKHGVDHRVSPIVFAKMQSVFDLLMAGMFIEANEELQKLPNDNLLTQDVKNSYSQLISCSNAIVTNIDTPLDTGIDSIAGTYKQVEVDMYGRIKSGSNPDTNIADVNGLQDALNAKVNNSAIGQNNGIASLDATGRVPSTQLPSYVDDVITFASYSNLPTTGEDGKIYITIDSNLTYRWNGSGYTEISPSLALGETSSTAYRGDRGKAAYDHSQTSGNPHGTDFSELENKPNTLAGYGITDVSINDISGLQDVLNSKADDTDLDEYLPLTGGNVYGNINAYNLLVNNKQVATQEWTTSQDYITKTTADSSYLDSTLKGIPDGVAELDSTGRVPSTQLPSYVDDVVVVESYSSLPTTGENGKIYITLDTNLTYRWNGSGYTEISPSLALGETSSTAYRGDRGKVAYDHSQTSGNPHGTDFSELENKPNTLAGYGITDGAERYHAFFDPSFFGEGTTSLYGHVRKAQYMTIDGNDVVPSSLMYQNVVQRFHMASLGSGTAGWLKVCSLTCVGGYTNEPITITLSRRGANKTCRLTIRFQSTNALNPYVELATYEGQNYGVYYHKREEGTYDIYARKGEPYDRCHITEFKSPYNIKLNSENGTVATPPTGSISFKQAPSDYSKTGRLTSEDWNSFTKVGIYNVAGWSGANGPTINGVQAYKWGFLVVEAFQGTVIQTYYPHQAGMPYYRQSWEGGAFAGWSTTPKIGAGLAPSTSFVYQSISASRNDNNAIYLCY